MPTMAMAVRACITADGKRQRDAAPPGLVIGNHIGRDHGLAVAGAGGVENAVDEGDADQRPGRAAVGLGGADRAREHAVEFRLLGENPADERAQMRRLADRGSCQRAAPTRRRLRRRRAECRWRRMKTAAQSAASRPRHCREIPFRTPPRDTLTRSSARYGQFTKIRLANWAPQAIVVFCASAGIWLSALTFGVGHFTRHHHVELAAMRQVRDRAPAFSSPIRSRRKMVGS